MMDMNSDLLDSINFKEHGPVELVAFLIKVGGDILTENSDTKYRWNAVLRQGAQGWFSNLCIESRVTFDTNALMMIFGDDFEIF